MNKAGLEKLAGHHVKLDPVAIATNGKPLDDDWKVTQVTATAVKLKNVRAGSVAILGHDAVYSFW